MTPHHSNLLLTMFIAICLLTLAVNTQEDYSPDSDHYNFQGYCPQRTGCISYNGTSFSEQFANKSKIDQAKELQSEIKKNPYMRKKFTVKESAADLERLGLYTKNTLEKGTTLALFPISRILSSAKLDTSQFNHTSYYKDDQKIFDQLGLTPGGKDEIAILALNIIYHLYHIEDSIYKSDLLFLFSSERELNPLLTFSEYEVNLLKHSSDALEYLKAVRKHFETIWDELSLSLIKKTTENQRKKVFAGRSTIPEADFNRVLAVIYEKSYREDRPLADGKTERFLFLIPFFSNMNKRYFETPVRDSYRFYKREYIDGVEYLRITSSEEFDKGSEMILDIPARRNHMFMINDGFIPEMNIEDCIPLVVGHSDFNKKFNLTDVVCAKPENGLFIRYYLSCNLVNMEEEDIKTCIDKFSRASNEDHKVKIMVEECPHPAWKKYNVFKDTIKSLKNEIKNHEFAIIQTEKYQYIRTKKGYSERNAKLILKFLRKRVDLIRSIKIEIEKLKHINNDLKKLNKDREDQKEMKTEL